MQTLVRAKAAASDVSFKRVEILNSLVRGRGFARAKCCGVIEALEGSEFARDLGTCQMILTGLDICSMVDAGRLL